MSKSVDVSRQREFGREVARAVGFDFSAGRLDETVHPFCVGVGPGDTRILTRYHPRKFVDGLLSMLHEFGHGLYEANLPKGRWFGLPSAGAVSLGIHESQSRFWENRVGRSLGFWEHFLPRARRASGGALAGVRLGPFHRALHVVRPTPIRTEADEVTYNLHILLRFGLERDLLSGQLPARELPGEWARRFEGLFGVRLRDDVEGCLQDVHWSAGLFGYFPTYTLGNLYSAQFAGRLCRDLPGWEGEAARGEFGSVREWLRVRIHRHGSRYRPGRLCRRVTGRDLSAADLLEDLRVRYGSVYGY